MRAADVDRFGGSPIVQVALFAGLELRREGAQLVGLCPLHAENSPSFKVKPATDQWHCFGCKKGGGYVALAEALGVKLNDALGPRDAAARPAHRQPPPAPQPRRLSPEELEALANDCRPATSDDGVSAWLRSRGFDPTTVEDRDLCRALPKDARLPRWASSKRMPWTKLSGEYRAIFPLYSPTGRFEGLRARAVQRDADPKALAPAGASLAGLVLADDLGRRMLGGDVHALAYIAKCAPRTGVIVAEGETDFLKFGTNWSDAAEYTPAILAVVAGAWSPAVADRIPSGTRVVIATDPDGPGKGYADEIAATLEERCDVRRWCAP